MASRDKGDGVVLSKEELNIMLSRNPSLQRRNKTLLRVLHDVGQTDENVPAKAPKYRNIKIYVYEDGFVSEGERLADSAGHGSLVEKYDSTKEYYRHQELLLLQRVGKISNLQRQVKLVIQAAFTYHDESIAAITYVADFVYDRDGEQIVEDVKGFSEATGKYIETKDFKLKWKLLKAKYPDKTFVLV